MIGELFAGRFEIKSMLGSGGMGAVYLAEHVVLQRQFAVKLLGAEVISDADMARFRREARAASRVDHPNVTAVVDFGHAEDGKPYLVMEYAEGPTLADAIAKGGAMQLPRALRILSQVVDALAAAHANGVIHRDLKAHNIVLTEREGHDFAKVLDFGLAKIIDRDATSAMTVDGELLGTPAYMAPEQCRGEQVDHRADIYAVGVLAFKVLAGRPPFEGPLVRQLTAHVQDQPPRLSDLALAKDVGVLDRLVERCLAKRPEDRYQSAKALAKDLLRIRQQLADAGTDESVSRPFDELTDHEDTATPAYCPWDSERSELTAEWATRTSVEQAHSRGIEELAFAIRDHGLGSPLISYALALKLRADDGTRKREADLATIDRLLADNEHVARERESRLRQALTQLEHERDVAKRRTNGQGKRIRDSEMQNAIEVTASILNGIQQSAEARRVELLDRQAETRRRLMASRKRASAYEPALLELLREVRPEELEELGDPALKAGMQQLLGEGNSATSISATTNAPDYALTTDSFVEVYAPEDAGAPPELADQEPDAYGNYDTRPDLGDTQGGLARETAVDRQLDQSFESTGLRALAAGQPDEARLKILATDPAPEPTAPALRPAVTEFLKRPPRRAWLKYGLGIGAVFAVGAVAGLLAGRGQQQGDSRPVAPLPQALAGPSGSVPGAAVRRPHPAGRARVAVQGSPAPAGAAVDAAGQTKTEAPGGTHPADGGPRAEPSGERRLELISGPPGARVFVDGRELGVTPLTLERPFQRRRRRRVVFRLAGHRTARVRIAPETLDWQRAGSHERATLSVRLRPRQRPPAGRVDRRAPAGAADSALRPAARSQDASVGD